MDLQYRFIRQTSGVLEGVPASTWKGSYGCHPSASDTGMEEKACTEKIIIIRGIRLWIYYGLDHGTAKPPYLVLRTSKQGGRATNGS